MIRWTSRTTSTMFRIRTHSVVAWLAGMDKRVYALDPNNSKSPMFHHQLDSKALGVSPNPADNNLVMVQTGWVLLALQTNHHILNFILKLAVYRCTKCSIFVDLILHTFWDFSPIILATVLTRFIHSNDLLFRDYHWIEDYASIHD